MTGFAMSVRQGTGKSSSSHPATRYDRRYEQGLHLPDHLQLRDQQRGPACGQGKTAANGIGGLVAGVIP
jgi:hypothetical protein